MTKLFHWVYENYIYPNTKKYTKDLLKRRKALQSTEDLYYDEIKWRTQLLVGEEYYYRPRNVSFYGDKVVRVKYFGIEPLTDRQLVELNIQHFQNDNTKPNRHIFFFEPINYFVRLKFTHKHILRIRKEDDMDLNIEDIIKTEEDFQNPKNIQAFVLNLWLRGNNLSAKSNLIYKHRIFLNAQSLKYFNEL